MIKETYIYDFSTFRHKLNENASKSEILKSSIEDLKKYHPRSQFTDIFIKNVQALISGEIESIPRKYFRLTMGEQWGLEFVDYLIRKNILRMEKINNTQILYSATSPVVRENIIDEKLNMFYQELIEDKKQNGIGWTNLKVMFEDRIFRFTNSGWIITWAHYEKGYGETRDSSQQEKNKQKIIDEVEESGYSRYLKNLLNKLDKENIEYDIERISEYDENDIQTIYDGHEGYLMYYTVLVKIKSTK